MLPKQDTIPERDFIEISLNWGQWGAAFWSIFWPAYLGGVLLLICCLAYLPLDFLPAHNWVISWCSPILILSGQGLLISRLTRKNYRTFWIAVFRENGITRTLSF